MKLNNIKTPTISIVMVTYNSSKYVHMAIESVLSSSYSNFELIISDDCSSDETWNIINNYQDPRIKASQNEINVGEYLNRNKCINLAQGKYLIFVDGDDILYSHGLEYFVKMFDFYNAAGIAFLSSYCNKIIYPIILKPK